MQRGCSMPTRTHPGSIQDTRNPARIQPRGIFLLCSYTNTFSRVFFTHLFFLKVVSFDAPEVVVAAEGGGKKLDPTRKAVFYGGIVEEDSGSHDLEWTQVR